MPTDRDRKARRVAEDRLATSYGWPEASFSRLGCAWIIAADLAALAAIGVILAFVFGIWRP